MVHNVGVKSEEKKKVGREARKLGARKVGARKVWQREKLGEKSGANRKVGHNVGKREKWGEKSEARKVGYKVGQQKWGKEKKVGLET